MKSLIEIFVNFIINVFKFIPDKILTNKYFRLSCLFICIVCLVVFGVFYYYLS